MKKWKAMCKKCDYLTKVLRCDRMCEIGGNMDIEELRTIANEKFLDENGKFKSGIGKPLCRRCNNTHESEECPLVLCAYCGTIHKKNELENWNYCEQNDMFKAKLKSHLEWCKENTKQIWSQPEKEIEEEGVESK